MISSQATSRGERRHECATVGAMGGGEAGREDVDVVVHVRDIA